MNWISRVGVAWFERRYIPISSLYRQAYWNESGGASVSASGATGEKEKETLHYWNRRWRLEFEDEKIIYFESMRNIAILCIKDTNLPESAIALIIDSPMCLKDVVEFGEHSLLHHCDSRIESAENLDDRVLFNLSIDWCEFPPPCAAVAANR